MAGGFCWTERLEHPVLNIHGLDAGTVCGFHLPLGNGNPTDEGLSRKQHGVTHEGVDVKGSYRSPF